MPAGEDTPARRQQPQPQILRDVRILIFVDQDELEPPLILPQHLGLFAEQADALISRSPKSVALRVFRRSR
jgi:hypothetical protein